MKAIIPVAGIGARLRPHTHSAPKVLLQVAGKAILGHILDQVTCLGVQSITFVVGYLGEMVREYVAENYPDIQAHYVEQGAPRGLGHAIWMTRDLHPDNEPLLIILGDTVFQADLTEAVNNPCSMIGVREVLAPQRFGNVEIGWDGCIRKLTEKPESPSTNLAIVGIYILKNPQLLYACLAEMAGKGLRDTDAVQLTDALQAMVDGGEKIRPYHIDGWYDCGSSESLLHTNRILLTRAQTDMTEYVQRYPDSVIIPPVSIADTADIQQSIIGPYASISEEARIRNSIISNSVISRAARAEDIVLESSIISDNAQVHGRRTQLNVGDASEISFD